MTSNVRSTIPAYGRTPKDLLRDPSVSPVAKAIYAMLDEVAGYEEVSIARLAGWLGMSENATRLHLHALRDAGWVVIEERFSEGRQFPNTYVTKASNLEGGVTENVTPPTPENVRAKTRRTTETPPSEERGPKESTLPGDWTPTAAHRQRADDAGLDVEREANKFRAHCEEKGRRAVSWNGAFTRWLLNAEDYAKRDGRQPASEELDADARFLAETGMTRDQYHARMQALRGES